MSWWLIPLVIVGVLLLALGALIYATSSDYQRRFDSFQRQCVAADGHIYNPGGISYCLTTDGRFVEVYP
jgi:hypothetical protein